MFIIEQAFIVDFFLDVQLSEAPDTLSRPVVIMRGPDAAKLMGIVNTQSEARIRIIYSPQDPTQQQQTEVYTKLLTQS
jgi:hypothetical protein